MTTRSTTTNRLHSTFRKDTHLHHIELRLADVQERQSFQRVLREADRSAIRVERSIRRRVGESLVRLGRRVGGDTTTTPAWQG